MKWRSHDLCFFIAFLALCSVNHPTFLFWFSGSLKIWPTQPSYWPYSNQLGSCTPPFWLLQYKGINILNLLTRRNFPRKIDFWPVSILGYIDILEVRFTFTNSRVILIHSRMMIDSQIEASKCRHVGDSFFFNRVTNLTSFAHGILQGRKGSSGFLRSTQIHQVWIATRTFDFRIHTYLLPWLYPHHN